MTGRRLKRRTPRMATGLLMGAVALSLVALGGIPVEVIAATAGIAFVAMLFMARARLSPLTDCFFWCLMAGAAITLFQVIPLPFELVEQWSPAAAGVHRSAAAALGTALPGRIALSLDPGTTLVMGLWWFCLASVYAAVNRLGLRGRVARGMIASVAVAALLLVVIGLVISGGRDHIPGLHWQFVGTDAVVLSTLRNPNHLAAVINLGMLASMGLAVSATAQARVGWSGAALFLAVGLALTGSRAGIGLGALAASTYLLSLLAPRRAIVFGIVGLAAGTTIVSSYGAAWLESLLGPSLWFDALHWRPHQVAASVAGHFPWTGSGFGSFHVSQRLVTGSAAHDTWMAVHSVRYAHSLPLHLMAEVGFVAGGALMVGLITAVVVRARGAGNDRLGRAVFLGLGAFAYHNLVDFSFLLLGPAMAFVVLLASTPQPTQAWTWSPKVAVSVVCALVGLGFSVWVALSGATEPGPRRDQENRANPLEAAASYPADWSPFLRAGVAGHDVGLLSHAAHLNPGSPWVALALGSASEGPLVFAWIRRALSISGDIRDQTFAFRLIQARSRTVGDILAALPPRPAMVARYLSWDQRTTYATRALVRRRFNNDPELLEGLAPMVRDRGDLTELDEIATQLLASNRTSGFRWVGYVAQMRGQSLEAYHMYLAAGDATSRMDAAEVALNAGWDDRARDALKDLKTTGSGLTRYVGLRRRMGL